MSVRLGEIARARAGDKGDTSILALVLDEPADLAVLLPELTAERLAAHFRVPVEAVSLVPVPGLGAVTVVVRDRLAGGVTRSATADPHGKTLSAHLLDLEVPWPDPMRR